ncbi:hypothetical protein CLV59_103523 [Chitinophaga dinghuensis]|uniref:Uncharacterized protein n=1 Tax=Chitinophaga dinghuensis TaxID=1539050 RepID=A0A327W5W4_9BACT|nr:hypothetical protein CLV59_103523 [Chitinophaga dinghuensis]
MLKIGLVHHWGRPVFFVRLLAAGSLGYYNCCIR